MEKKWKDMGYKERAAKLDSIRREVFEETKKAMQEGKALRRKILGVSSESQIASYKKLFSLESFQYGEGDRVVVALKKAGQQLYEDREEEYRAGYLEKFWTDWICYLAWPSQFASEIEYTTVDTSGEVSVNIATNKEKLRESRDSLDKRAEEIFQTIKQSF